MPIKYIPYTPDTVNGQAILGEGSIQRFHKLKYRNQKDAQEVLLKGIPFYETEVTEIVGDSEKAKENLIIHGDCLNAIAYLKDNGIKVDLVYIDPPFASGADYAKKIYIRKNPDLVKKLEQAQKLKEGEKLDNSDLISFEETMYGDIWEKEDYLNWIYERLLAIRDILSDTGSIYVHLDWHIGHYVKVLMDEVFGEENFRNEIIWGYRIQGINQKTFARKHDTIFFYSKSEEYHFNPEKERVVYETPFIDTQKESPNLLELTPKDKQEINDAIDEGRPLKDRLKSKLFNRYYSDVYVRDVWDCDKTKPIISGSNEYLGYITQKPEGLLQRIIETSSDSSMLIADFFGGSGVTAKVAHDLGRRFITSDVGINAIETMRDRLKDAGASFEVREVQDGVKLFRNPEQTQAKLVELLNLSTTHEFGSFFGGAKALEGGELVPVYLPDIKGAERTLTVGKMSEILDNTPDSASSVLVYYVTLEDQQELEKFVREEDKRNQDGKKIEYLLLPLQDVLDDVRVDDRIAYTATSTAKGIQLDCTSFYSKTLLDKITAYNQKKYKKQTQSTVDEAEESESKEKFKPIEISEKGLELIEMAEGGRLEGTVWHALTTYKLDKVGYLSINGAKSKELWDGTCVLDKSCTHLKVRNIAGDEIVVPLTVLQ